mmetsp:Transcript_33076/g.29966  ORF Transcript_33076/g.29966 Transcript_33076/m.29966 type:complete len:147 (+) Transcript_33076:184-624(+)
MDFWTMVMRLQDIDGNGLASYQRPQQLFYSEMEANRDLKGSNLWMAVPFKDEESMIKTQSLLAKKEIPTFSAKLFDEEQIDAKNQPQIQIWNENGALESKLSFDPITSSEVAEEKYLSELKGTNDLKINEGSRFFLKGIAIENNKN